MEWLVPRHLVSGGTPDDAMAQELQSELCGDHITSCTVFPYGSLGVGKIVMMPYLSF